VLDCVTDLEAHYNAAHRHVCQTCGQRFLSTWLLEIHFQERHDTYFKVLAEKQSMVWRVLFTVMSEPRAAA